MNFSNSIMKLIDHRKLCRKIDTRKGLLINAFKFPLQHLCSNTTTIFATVPTKELTIISPYLDKMSQVVKARLTKSISKHNKFCKLRVIFQTSNGLKNYFCFNNFAPETLQSSFNFKFLCGTCTVSHFSMTSRHFQSIRIFPQEQVNQSKVPCEALLGITCLFVTIK